MNEFTEQTVSIVNQRVRKEGHARINGMQQYREVRSHWIDIVENYKQAIIWKMCSIVAVQSRFSDIKFSDNLWFSDYFEKTIFSIYYIHKTIRFSH